jgi:hypothetical protein
MTQQLIQVCPFPVEEIHAGWDYSTQILLSPVNVSGKLSTELKRVE